MNPEIKAKWVAALRSGEYKQGKDRLRSRDNKFCCLGVLCNLHAQAHPEIAAMQPRADAYMGEEGYYPAAVAEWAGLRHRMLTVSIEGNDSNIASHNDRGATFEQIADAIEAQL